VSGARGSAVTPPDDLIDVEAPDDLEDVPAPAPAAAPRARSVPAAAARGLGLGVRSVVEGAAASIPGMVYDAAAAPISLVSLALGGPRVRSAGEVASAASDAVGLPSPETAAERVQGRLQREVVGTLGGMAAGRVAQAARGAPETVRQVGRALAEQPGTQMAGALGSGAAGAAAREAAPDSVAGDIGASVAGGIGAAAAYPAARMAARGTMAALAPLSEGGRRRVVGSALQQSARNPEGLTDRLRQTGEEIPGVRPTTAEVSGDAGLFSLERTLRNTPEGGPEFAVRDAARDQARREAVSAIEPTSGTAADAALEAAEAARAGRLPDIGPQGRAPEVQDAVRGAVTRRFDDLTDQQGRAEGLAQARRSRLPPPQAPEVQGSAIRADLNEAGEQAARRTSDAYEAVDPEGTSQLPLAWVRAAADVSERTYWGRLSGGMPRDLADAVRDVRELGVDTVSWRELQTLRARLGKLVNDQDSRVQATALRMRQAIDDTAEEAARPFQPAGAPRGLADIDAAEAAEGMAARPDVRQVLDDVGMARADARAGGNSLVQFLRQDPPRAPGQARGAFGGIRDPEGHIRAAIGDPRRMPGLIDQRGRTYEQAMQEAIDAGYFPGRTLQHDANNPGATLTLDEFLEAITDEIHGRRRLFPAQNTAAREGAEGRRALYDQVDRELSEAGVSVHDDAGQVARAVRPIDDAAPRAPMDRPDGRIEIPEDQRFTPGQAARWREATEAQRDEGARFLDSPVGDVRRMAMGRPVVPDSGVAQRFFRSGSGAPEAANQFISAVGDRPGAVRALEGYATQAMEAYARTGDGRMSAERMRRWMDHHSEALKRFPELRSRLRQWAEAQSRVEDVAARKVEWTRETERGALRAMLHQEPEEAIARALSAANAEENVRMLTGILGNHPGAIRALRRAYLDAWMSRSRGPVDVNMEDRISAAQARRWVEQTERAARALFTEEQWARIRQIDRDIASGTRVATVGRAIGSNTMQNASTAYFLAQLTNGAIASETMLTRLVGGTAGRLLSVLAQAPAEEIRRLMIQAAADPKLARELILEANPRRVEDAARAIRRLMDPMRFRRAVLDAGAREIGRAVVAQRAAEPEGRREDARAQ
jgi:hypothetical protein